MRQYLVNKFACSACGCLLTISDEDAKEPPYCEGEPTGADMKHTLILLDPCENCKRKEDNINAALAVLLRAVEE